MTTLDDLNTIRDMNEALDSMDDFARMADIEPIGPLAVLQQAIKELEIRRLDVLRYENMIESNAVDRYRMEAELQAMADQLALVESAFECLQSDNERLLSDLKLANSRVVDWKPIDSAPKDGVLVLLYTASGICEGYCHFGEWIQMPCHSTYDGCGDAVLTTKPTHFAKLPLPPEKSK